MTTTLTWTRTPQGLMALDGRIRIERHEIDDRADYGERHTYWHLIVDNLPVEVHRYQRDAKADAERTVRLLAELNIPAKPA